MNKIVIIVSHPIQHFVPAYESWTNFNNCDLYVIFASSLGVKKYEDKNFGTSIQWNISLDKINYEFLKDSENNYSINRDELIKLNKRLNELNPDALIIYGYSQKIQRNAYKWALKNGKKMIYISDSELRHERPVWKNIIKYLFIKQYFKKINYFFTVGNANIDYYRFYGVPHNKLIYSCFPIDINLYNKSYKQKLEIRTDLRNHFEIEDSTIVIGVVGKLVNWKSQIDIIRLLRLAEIKSKQKYVAFIIGTGDNFNSLSQEAKELKQNRVIMTGFVKPEELPKYYASIDIYTHPSIIEPHSLAISEAAYMGCSLLISDKCGSWGVLDDLQIGKNGYIYKTNDINEMWFYLQKLSNQEVRNSFSKYSHQFAEFAQFNAHYYAFKSILTQL